MTFTKTLSLYQESNDTEDEEESEEDIIEAADDFDELRGTALYYSDVTTEDEDLEYNPWTEEINETPDNPAIFLAEKEQVNEQNNEWNFKKDIHVGPLDQHQQHLFQQVLADNVDVCASSQLDIGRTNLLKHEINTANASPVAQQAYKTNPVKKEFIEREIIDMENRQLIRRSMSPWAAPVVIVEKKDEMKRFCVDYRRLNKVTKPDRFPLPRIDDLLESFRTANWFTTMDLASEYWQIEMNEEDKEKTAFITHKGLYEFNIMPFDLRNAPGTYQHLMNYILQDYIGKFIAVYLDDIIIYSKTFEQHIDHVKLIFKALRKAILKIKLKKCYFCFPNITFLGHIVGRNGIAPDPAKVEKIKNFPRPTSLKELRGALGLFSYYRKFVRDFSKIAKPMLNLLKQDVPFLWEEQQQTSFEELKQRLMEAPILQYPDFTKPFVLYPDASGTGLGAVLSQIDEEKRERVIAYASRSLNKAECNYGITDQECLAIVWAVKHFEQYLGLLPFKVITDHSALKFLQTAKMPTGKRARWIMYLQQFQFEIVHRPGKENKNADALSRISEAHCFFLGVENQEGEGSVEDENFENTFDFVNLTPEDFEERDYEGDSEDNASEIHATPSKTMSEITQMMKDIRKDMRELDQMRTNREKRHDQTKIETQKCLEISSKLINPEKKARLRIIENHSDDEISNDSIAAYYNPPIDEGREDNNYTYGPSYFGRWDEWNKEVKQDENLVRQEPIENENGWGAEYYENTNEWYDPVDETVNESWGLPDLSNEMEQHIEEVWGYQTVAWTYTKQEITTLVNNTITTQWVIANQPTRRGKWKCDDYCDIENHHVHVWCEICQARIDHQEKLNHNCRFGLGVGQIHPEMDPQHLINDVFWSEPPLVIEKMQEEINEDTKHRNHLQQILEINNRHLNELNGEETSRTPLIEDQTKLNLGKRFRPY